MDDKPKEEETSPWRLQVPLTADEKKALGRAAARNRRTSPAQVVYYIEQGLRADGLWPPTDP